MNTEERINQFLENCERTNKDMEIERLRMLLIHARKALYENPANAKLVARIDHELEDTE